MVVSAIIMCYHSPHNQKGQLEVFGAKPKSFSQLLRSLLIMNGYHSLAEWTMFGHVECHLWPTYDLTFDSNWMVSRCHSIAAR